MATKEKALEDFLKCFRISINYILLYSKGHKSFLASVADLKEKTEALFVYLNPIEIIFTPDSLSVEGVVYSKMNLHKELALLFHQRKIQSLMLTRGITGDELVILLDKLSLAPKEIIKSGGLSVILSDILKNAHFSVTNLDYSQLLRGEGEEIRDIWVFMLHNAIAQEDSKKIDEFTDNFEIAIQKFKAVNLVEDKELKDNLSKFLEHLKKTDQEKFLRCSRAILKLVLKDKSVLMDEEKAKKLKSFLIELNTDDYAQVLWNEILNNENFDASSFQLFSKLLERDEHEKIASHLAGNLSRQEFLKIPTNVSRKIKELFSSSSGSSLVPEIYRRAMLSIGESPIFKDAFVFDRKQLLVNYRFILLNLLFKEKNSQRQEVLADKLFKEWENIAEENDTVYLKCLREVIEKKKTENFEFPAFLELSRKFYNFIEVFIWEETLPPGIADLLGNMEASSLGVEVYLQKMFEEGKINIRVLKAFFRFFPNRLPDFYACLKEKWFDIDILAKVLESLREINSPLTLPIIEYIYSFSSSIIKIEIIRIMAGTGKYNREFIFEVLKNGGSFLKKEALVVFSEQQDNQKALEILFMLPNPWGKNNGILMENLEIVEDLDYKQAKEYLEYLYRNTAFWNIRLKKRIKKVMRRLNV